MAVVVAVVFAVVLAVAGSAVDIFPTGFFSSFVRLDRGSFHRSPSTNPPPRSSPAPIHTSPTFSRAKSQSWQRYTKAIRRVLRRNIYSRTKPSNLRLACTIACSVTVPPFERRKRTRLGHTLAMHLHFFVLHNNAKDKTHAAARTVGSIPRCVRSFCLCRCFRYEPFPPTFTIYSVIVPIV